MSALSRVEIEQDLPWNWTPARVSHLLKHDDTNAYVIGVDEQLAGFSIASFNQDKAHLVLLAVSVAHRRQGLGSQLLDWQLAAAQTAGLQSMTLEVRDKNREARLFYQNQGFSYVRTLYQYYSGQEHAVRMCMAPIRRLD